jgi:hypothetical protein
VNVTMGRERRIPGRIYRLPPEHRTPIVKKPLAALLLTAATVATLAVPAGAAVPKHDAPNATLTCGTRSARVWVSFTRMAADNQCKSQWLVISVGNGSQSDPMGYSVSVAPGAHFNWAGDHTLSGDIEQDVGWNLAARPWCSDGGRVINKHSHGKPGGPCPA